MPVTLTERAAKKVKSIMSHHKLPETACLRVAVKGGGCSGMAYALDVAAEPGEQDEVFESRGVRICSDPKSLLKMDGTQIDFQDELLKGSFVFNNPNAVRKCNCGSSFST